MIERRRYVCTTCAAEVEMTQAVEGTWKGLKYNVHYTFDALKTPPHDCGVRRGLIPPEVDTHPTMRRVE